MEFKKDGSCTIQKPSLSCVISFFYCVLDIGTTLSYPASFVLYYTFMLPCAPTRTDSTYTSFTYLNHFIKVLEHVSNLICGLCLHELILQLICLIKSVNINLKESKQMNKRSRLQFC